MTVVTKTIQLSESPKEIRLSRYIQSPVVGDCVEISVSPAYNTQSFATIVEIIPEVILESGTTITAVFTNGKWTCPEIGYEHCQSKIMHHLYDLRKEMTESRQISHIDAFIDKCWKSKNTTSSYHGMKYESYSTFPSTKKLNLEKRELKFLNILV